MKILMVCLGNICRSPMAEGIMAHMIHKQRLPWHVDSAGTSNYHEGEAPDYRSILKMEKYGIDISLQRSRPFSEADFDRFDLILCMDENNLLNVAKKAKNDAHKAKISMIMEYVHPGERMGVPDPYYGGEAGFEKVYQMLWQACEKVIEHHGK